MGLSKEWLNANQAKAYPLKSETGGVAGTLPCDLLTAATILVEDPAIRQIWISGIMVTDLSWSLSLKVATQNNTTINFPDIVTVSRNSEQYSVAKFTAANGGVCLCGSFTVGNPDAVSKLPSGMSVLSLEQGELDPSTISDISGLVLMGIRVGDTLLTGEIELVAEDGIELVFDETTNKLTIVNTKYSIPSENLEITSDTELLDQIQSTYGKVITTINGVEPDAAGDIKLVLPTTEADDRIYIAAEPLSDGALTLSITKDPYVSIKSIETLAQNLEQLSIRAAKIDSSIKEADAAINSISTQMTRLS